MLSLFLGQILESEFPENENSACLRVILQWNPSAWKAGMSSFEHVRKKHCLLFFASLLCVRQSAQDCQTLERKDGKDAGDGSSER